MECLRLRIRQGLATKIVLVTRRVATMLYRFYSKSLYLAWRAEPLLGLSSFPAREKGILFGMGSPILLTIKDFLGHQ